MLAAVLAGSKPVAAQSPLGGPAIGAGDVLSAGVAAALVVAPRAFGWGPQSPDCAVPCDPGTLPWFDRWSVHAPVTGWSDASDALAVAMGVGTVAVLAGQEQGTRHIVAAVQAGLWAEGITGVLKAAVGRERPILYTPGGVGALTDRESFRSFPSGHTAGAFALATSLWMSERDLHGHPGAVGWLGFVGAAGMGVLRVAAGKHFLSDVLAGAAVGTASAIVVHLIKF